MSGLGTGPGTFSEPPGILVIPWQHLLCLSQSHHGSRSQYSSLAHASTQGFAEAPSFLNEAFGSTDQRPDWCTKTLREERRDSWNPSWRWGRWGLHSPGPAGPPGSGVQLYPQWGTHTPSASGRSAYLREAEGYRVTMLHEAGGGHTQSHGCIHQSRPIQVDPSSIGVG